MAIPTADTRPSFPYNQESIVGGVYYAQMLENQICEWNLKIEREGTCSSSNILPIFSYVNWKPTTYEETKEVINDGFGGQQVILKKIEPIYRFETFCSESVLKNFYLMSASAVEWKFTSSETIPDVIVVFDLSVSHSVITDKLFKVTVDFKTEEEDESVFGITGCCRNVYEEAPYDNPCDPSTLNLEEVKAHQQFVASGNTVVIPESPDEVLAVFKDNVHIVKGATYMGYTDAGATVTLSENVLTNNPNGGETVLILYKVIT